MPLKQKQKSKGNNRKKYTTHIVDVATEARLNPMPNISTASSSQGSPASSQASVAAPAMGSAPPPTYMCPPAHPGNYGTVPPFGTFPPPSYQFFPPYSVPPQNLPLPQQQQNPPLQQIPPQQNPPFPQQQQNPPQPQQENVVEEGGGELVMFHDDFPDYPRDSLRRYILKPSGNSFLPCKPAAEAIISIIHNCYGHFWKTYGDLDDNEKDRWFKLFESKCSWETKYNDIMRRNFHIRAAARFSDFLRRARMRFEETRKRPHWIGPPIFDELVKYWASPEFKEKSDKAKKNRASEKGGCIHTGGCLSNGEHLERMATRLRREPFINELHDLTHKNKLGQYCDERARTVQEEYDRQLAEAISQGSTIDHTLTFNTWKKVAGDKKKGKLYGLGNLATNYRKGSVASTFRLTLNQGEGTSQQPQLTPEMLELIHRLSQEQFSQQMASQAALVQDLINRQKSYEEQLARLMQAQDQAPSHTRAPVLSPNVEPYPVYEVDDVDDADDVED